MDNAGKRASSPQGLRAWPLRSSLPHCLSCGACEGEISMSNTPDHSGEILAGLDARTALSWYDFLCPFCYVGQHRTAILIRHGLRVVELPFQAHPDIPLAGIAAGPRNGPMYAMLEREAKEAGVPLRWPPRLPNTRRALAAAEWVRRHRPRGFPQLHKDLFAAHFVLGEDLGDPAVIDRHARESGI